MDQINANEHQSLIAYRDTMSRIIQSIYPEMDMSDIKAGVDYSISKRFKNFNLWIQNNYTGTVATLTVLDMLDYINRREPILTSYGTMFKRHADVPNPLSKVIQNFLDLRKQHKKEMFKYPKGSEMFERYNLLQTLDKIDVNGIYGLIGLYVSLIYDLNICPAVTSTGRSLISSAIMCFEGFLGNNVQFGSLNDILIFIDNVRLEHKTWKYNDYEILTPDGFISVEECFNKLILNCGYKYIPSYEDMEIVWKIIRNCTSIELNRLFYKNNLYSFMDVPTARNLMIKIITEMRTPYINPTEPPKEIIPDLDALKDLLIEYVFYCHQYMDRVIRNKEMIKKISLVSDTDSSFISLDAWYNYNMQYLQYYDCPILHQSVDLSQSLVPEKKVDEPLLSVNGEEDSEEEEIEEIDISVNQIIEPVEVQKDYDFYNDKIIERTCSSSPIKTIPQDNMKFALINIMCYILSTVINLYMIDFTKQSKSYRSDSLCKINMKNEFYMARIMLTYAKKNYASLQILQEGNYLGDGVLSVSGIPCLAKSSTSKDTQKALRKILLEDILTCDSVDQLKLIKDIAILEKTIYTELQSGSKKYYKPVIIKSMDNYKLPFRIQGIKAAIAWNYVKDNDFPGFNLGERNSLDVIKIKIDKYVLETIKDTYPQQYAKFKNILDPNSLDLCEETIPINVVFRGSIDSIGLPKDLAVPEWLKIFIDYDAIITDNLSGFPLSSVGICQFGNKKATYSNVIHL